MTRRVNRAEVRVQTVGKGSVYLSIDFELQPKNTTWKLNSSLLNDPGFKKQFKEEISAFLEFNDNGEVSNPILWDTLKAVLRGKIIAISSYKKKNRNKTLDDLHNKLRELENNHKSRLLQDTLN